MIKNNLKGRDFIDLQEFKLDEIEEILDLASELKKKFLKCEQHKLLDGKTLFMIFYNKSLRTRNSFEAGITQLGGHANFLEPEAIYSPALEDDEKAYSTERVSDVARVLSGMGHGISIRIYGNPCGWVYGRGNRMLHEFAEWSDIPVINMEDDMHHPCQALADIMTMREKLNKIEGKKLVMSWAYSPSVEKPVSVPQSVILGASMEGMDITLAHPRGLELDPEIIGRVKKNIDQYGGSIDISHDMKNAFEGADIVYPKSWTSLQFIPPKTSTPQLEKTKELFDKNKHWICNQEMIEIANQNVLYMHCLPADRGFEVTNDVIDGSHSIVFDQAKNRLHVAKAVMALTM